MFNVFKKKKEGEEPFDAAKLDMILRIAKSMGFDVYQKLETFMPHLLAQYLALEHKAGSRLMLTLTVSDDSSHFILSCYGLQADGTATVQWTYPIDNVPALIEKFKQTLANPPADVTDAPPQHIALASGQPADLASPGNAAPHPEPESEPDPYDFGASAWAASQRAAAAAGPDGRQ